MNKKAVILGAITFFMLSVRLVNMLNRGSAPVFQNTMVQTHAVTPQMPSSVHYGERALPIRHIVVHSFALPVPDMVRRLDDLKVSTHYLIDTAGNVTHLVPDDKVAWHAGQSFWRGETGLNATSIGIELQNDTLGQTSFPSEQMAAFQILVKDLMYRYHIDPKNIVAHSDIAPTRKADVGHAFPWQYMARVGIGLWPNEDQNPTSEIKDIKLLLKKIGYDTTDVDKALLAFERHFMPELIKVDNDIPHLEENLVGVKPVLNDAVIRRLNQVATLYQ